MNVWIFVISALFTPVVEPLGLSMEEAATASFIEPAAIEPGIDLGTVPEVVEPRYHGIERMLAELDAGRTP